MDLIIHYDDVPWDDGTGNEAKFLAGPDFDSTMPLRSFLQLREGFDPRLLAAMTGLGPSSEVPLVFPARGLPAHFLGSAGDFPGFAHTESIFDSWLSLGELDRLLNESRLEVGQLNLATRLLLAVLDFLWEKRAVAREFESS